MSKLEGKTEGKDVSEEATGRMRTVFGSGGRSHTSENRLYLRKKREGGMEEKKKFY